MKSFKFDDFDNKTKKKRNFKLGVFFKILTALMIISFLIFSPIFLFNREIYFSPVEKFFSSPLKTKVLSLVHVETFEGGLTSRATFLEKQATAFNKKNTDVYITVKTLTPEQLKLNYSKNFCDIISFGFGVGDIVKDDLLTLPKVSFREDFLEACLIDKNLVAYPYMFGGYTAITREQTFNNFNFEKNDLKNLGNIIIKNKNKTEYSLGFSKSAYTNIAESLVVNNVSTNEEYFYENNLSPYEMYENFLGGKFATLIGTNRDVIRLKDRELKGTVSSLVYNYLEGYTDLVQYIGILSDSIEKQEISKEFLKFIMEDDTQKSLAKVGLFSPVLDSIYENGFLKEQETILSKKLKVPSAFLSLEEINKLKTESFKKVVL